MDSRSPLVFVATAAPLFEAHDAPDIVVVETGADSADECELVLCHWIECADHIAELVVVVAVGNTGNAVRGVEWGHGLESGCLSDIQRGN